MILEIFAVVCFILSFTLAWTSYNQIQKVEDKLKSLDYAFLDDLPF